MGAAYKWVPVINQDACTGCGCCVQACDHGCLELVWSFATLQQPQACGSEGNCMAACPEDVIRMDWVRMTADQGVGRWREAAPERETAAGKSWLSRLLLRPS